MDLPNEKVQCHLTGFKQSCKKLVTSGKCERWMLVQGSHPQTDEKINQYKCIDNWMPILLIENSKLQNEIGASLDSFRNEMMKQNNEMLTAFNTVPMIDITTEADNNG